MGFAIFCRVVKVLVLLLDVLIVWLGLCLMDFYVFLLIVMLLTLIIHVPLVLEGIRLLEAFAELTSISVCKQAATDNACNVPTASYSLKADALQLVVQLTVFQPTSVSHVNPTTFSKAKSANLKLYFQIVSQLLMITRAVNATTVMFKSVVNAILKFNIAHLIIKIMGFVVSVPMGIILMSITIALYCLHIVCLLILTVFVPIALVDTLLIMDCVRRIFLIANLLILIPLYV